MIEPVLHIPKIEAGIVIDHIPVGYGLRILTVIRSYPEMEEVITTVGLNCASAKLGHKDLIKLQVQDLPPRLQEHLALVCSGMTIKRIQGYAVQEKITTVVPAEIVGLARCRNPNCITNHEGDVVTRFRREEPPCRRFRCAFCERVFELEELPVLVGAPG
jgi:aspartate carbamoyltransferase regulatory subunit